MHEPRLTHPTGRFPVRAIALLAGPILALAACGNADSSLGRSFSQGGGSDDVRVNSRPPLSLPPEFTMRPDRPGVIRPVAAAQSPTQSPARTSAGQEALLDASGPAAAPNIRTKVNEDARLETPDPGFTDQLMTWQRPPDQRAIIQRGSSSGGLLGRIF